MSRPDIGLYQTKFAARRLLDKLPGIDRLEPNAVSIASIAPAALAAVALANGWWIIVPLGIAGRMVLTTLDGLIAEKYGKASRVGAYVNRLPAEIGDVLILLALFARAEPLWVGLVLAGAWLVNVLGVLGLVAGGSTQAVGPAGQTDRLAFLAFAAIVAAVTPIDWTLVCQILVALLAVTIVLRISRTIRELRVAP